LRFNPNSIFDGKFIQLLTVEKFLEIFFGIVTRRLTMRYTRTGIDIYIYIRDIDIYRYRYI